MRQHFHRCPSLRTVTVDAREISGDRKGGHQILDELCAVRGFSRCLGLVDCDILSPAQKRELLVARVTRMREEEGSEVSSLGDIPNPRRVELAEVRADLLDEREEINETNRRLVAETTGASDWSQRDPTRNVESLAAMGVSVWLDEQLRGLRGARLDAIDRALEALEAGDPFACIRCKRSIEAERIRLTPDSRVCEDCARDALPPEEPPSGPVRRRFRRGAASDRASDRR